MIFKPKDMYVFKWMTSSDVSGIIVRNESVIFQIYQTCWQNVTHAWYVELASVVFSANA